MTQDQLLPAMLIAALSGGVAGLFALRSYGLCGVALLAAIASNVLGWTVYGYSLRMQQGETLSLTQMLAGLLLVLPGLLVFLGLPALGVCFLSAVVCRVLRHRGFPL